MSDVIFWIQQCEGLISTKLNTNFHEVLFVQRHIPLWFKSQGAQLFWMCIYKEKKDKNPNQIASTLLTAGLQTEKVPVCPTAT